MKRKAESQMPEHGAPNRIAEIREMRGLSKHELGRLLQTSAQQISHLEKGDRRLTLDWMQRIAKALECDPSDLLPQQPPAEPDEELLLRWHSNRDLNARNELMKRISRWMSEARMSERAVAHIRSSGADWEKQMERSAELSTAIDSGMSYAIENYFQEGGGAPFENYVKAVVSARLDAMLGTGDDWMPPPNARPSEAEPRPQIDRRLPYIPVYGTAQGGPEGRFELYSADTIDRLPRPQALAHAKNIYAIYVEGDSMSPAYEPGDPAVINPDRAPKIGDYVAIFLKRGEGNGEPSGYIKRLVRRTADKVIVEQLNPKREMTFRLSDIQQIHRVYRPAELIMV